MMSYNCSAKQSIKEICNGFGCFNEAAIRIQVPVGDKMIVLEICEKCLHNFVEDKERTRNQNAQTNTNTVKRKSKVVRDDSGRQAQNQSEMRSEKVKM